MKRSKYYLKPILALEGPSWNADFVNPLNISPILEILGRVDNITTVHLASCTQEEFSFNLDVYKEVKTKGVLLFSFHGLPGRLLLPNSEIEIEQLGQLMRRKFKGWGVYFDACLFLQIEKKRIDAFIQKTGVSFVIGHTKIVPWIEGTAIELIMLNWLQRYRNMGTFWSRFRKAHGDLIKLTGLTFCSNGH